MTKISNGGKDQRLKCEDGGRGAAEGNCDKSLDYYLVNKTGWDQQGLYVTCFVSEKGESCLPPLTLDDVATHHLPAEEVGAQRPADVRLQLHLVRHV